MNPKPKTGEVYRRVKGARYEGITRGDVAIVERVRHGHPVSVGLLVPRLGRSLWVTWCPKYWEKVEIDHDTQT